LFSNLSSQKRRKSIKKNKIVFIGEIYDKGEACNYMVQSFKDLKVIIDHFKRFPLLTQKCADFELFSQIFYIMEKRLTLEGLNKY